MAGPALTSAWSVIDYRQPVVSSQPATGGVAEARLPQVPQDELWLLERAVVMCNSTAATKAFLYLNSADDRNTVDGTVAGNFDVADQNSPIQIPGGSLLICRWVGAVNGSTGTLRAQLTVLKRRI